MVAPWRLCRQCCCRYGCFPLLIVPIVTLGCFLSLYSSAGCKFVHIDIGFNPTNEGWDASPPFSFGPLFYHNVSVQHDSMYREALHTGCVSYSDSFYEDFIAGDRTFKMIRIMTYISCASSGLAMFVSWIFVISPIPAGVLWPAVLLPSIMVAFISEGSKFLIFDTALCRSSMWYRGSLLVPETAEACTMGETGWFACAAGILHFWALVCVCLRAPERRTLQKNAGPPENKDAAKEEQESTSDDPDLKGGDNNGSRDSSFLKMEEGDANSLLKSADTMNNDLDKKEASKRSFRFADTDLTASNQCASDLPLKLMPIDTNSVSMARQAECCSPMSEGKPVEAKSPELVPDIPTRESNRAMSPVDFIIEGFDVATDLSQIDVCRTMVYSPTPTYKALELQASHSMMADELQTETPSVDRQQSVGQDKVTETTKALDTPADILPRNDNNNQSQTASQGQTLDAAAFRSPTIEEEQLDGT